MHGKMAFNCIENFFDLDEETTWVLECTIENATIVISMTAKFNPNSIHTKLIQRWQ